MRKFSTCLLALATVLVVPSLAHADDLFTVTGPGGTATFSLPSTPTSITTLPYGFSTTATVDLNGVYSKQTITFYDQADTGGINFFGLAGLQLYSGTSSSPYFLPGTFLETTGNPTSPAFPADANGSVLIAPTPEPSSIALLGTGLLGIVGVARRRFKA